MTKSGQITFTFTTKSDKEIGLSDKILSAVYLTCIRPDFETPDTRHADIKQSRNFHVVKKINRLIRSLRTFCHSVSSVLLLLCKAQRVKKREEKTQIFGFLAGQSGQIFLAGYIWAVKSSHRWQHLWAKVKIKNLL